MEPNETSAARRHLGAATLAALSAITGIVSYQHGLAVVRWVGNTGLVAFLVPLVPDLMIVSSSLTLIEAAAVGARRPWTAVVALAGGIGWTVAMNVAAGSRNGPGGALVAAGIPVAFVVTFESLLWMRKLPRAAPARAARGHVAATLDEAILAALEVSSQRVVADAFEISRARVQKAVASVATPDAGAVDPPPSGEQDAGDPPRPPARWWRSRWRPDHALTGGATHV